MAPRSLRGALLRLLSRWLWAGATLLARQAATADRLAGDDGSVAGESSVTLPPWLSPTGGGPPAHWLAYIAQKAPFLLRHPRGVEWLTPSRSLPASTAPSPWPQEGSTRPPAPAQSPLPAGRTVLSRPRQWIRSLVGRFQPKGAPAQPEQPVPGGTTAGRRERREGEAPPRPARGERGTLFAPVGGPAQPLAQRPLGQEGPSPPQREPGPLQTYRAASPQQAGRHPQPDTRPEAGGRARLESVSFRSVPGPPAAPTAPPASEEPEQRGETPLPELLPPPGAAPASTPVAPHRPVSLPEPSERWLEVGMPPEDVQRRGESPIRLRHLEQRMVPPPEPVAPEEQPAPSAPETPDRPDLPVAEDPNRWAGWEAQGLQVPLADEEESGQTGPWPALLEQDLDDDGPPAWWDSRWQAWRRQVRLDREQRGLPWNE